jgi:hypothetical protein
MSDSRSAANQEPRTKNQEPRTKNKEQRTKNSRRRRITSTLKLNIPMKTKIPHLILAGLFGTTIASQGAATLINVDDANNGTGVDQGGTASLGTLSLSTQIPNFSNNATLGYTVTGLDLDGIGGNDDEVVINFLATSSTGNINTRPLSGTNAQLGTSDGANGSFLNGDSSNLEITFSDISVNLNGGSNNGWAAFNGFYELNLSSFSTAGEETNINGVLYTVDGGNSNPFAIFLRRSRAKLDRSLRPRRPCSHAAPQAQLIADS